MDSKTRELLKTLSACEDELTRLHSSRDPAMGGHTFTSGGPHHCLACDEWAAACNREMAAKRALTDHAAQEAAKPDSPQSCYPDEIETLRGMLEEERERIGGYKADSENPYTSGEANTARARVMAESERRIEALTTAIEAMAGAL